MLNALVWNLVLTAGLATVLAASCRLPLLRRRPALRHWLWLLVVAKLVTPPLIPVPVLPALANNHDAVAMTAHGGSFAEDRPSAWDRHSLAPSPAAGDKDSAETVSDAESTAPRELTGNAQGLFLGAIVAISLVGTCVFLTVHAIHAVKLQRWLTRAAAEDSSLAGFCAGVALKLDVGRSVRSCVVDARTTPMLWGWRRPLVVMPRDLMECLSPQELRGVVAHELAHVLRGDRWANTFVFVVKALMWWNPVVWWADVELRAAQELCCDAVAIDFGNSDRRGYATTLLKALDFIQTELPAPRALAVGMGSRRTILRRFEMIGEKQIRYRLSRYAFLPLLALMIALVCIPVRARAKPVAPAASSGSAATPAEAGAKKDKPAKEKKATGGIVIAGVIAMLNKESKENKETVLGERPKGDCSLSGKVISDKTGEPIPNARMYLHYGVTHGSIFVHTAPDGTFTIKDIPVGPYSFQMSHTHGYQAAVYNPEGKPGSYPPFSLKEGEQRTGIVLRAKPACRVTGKVLDEDGQIPDGVDKLTVLAWFKNDDKKTYELEQTGVNPKDGSYVVDYLDGRPVHIMAINWQAAKEGDAYPPIYYPGVFSRNDAKLITFDKSPTVEGVNFTLRKEGGLVLEGTVRDESGKPVPEAFVVVNRRDMLFDFNTAYTDQQGHYQIQGLGEGEFCVHVDAVHRGLVRTRAPVELDKSKSKTQHDFTLVRGATISGKLVDENGKMWRIGDSFGSASVEPPQELKKDHRYSSCYSLTQFWNKHRNKQDLTRGMGGSFSLGTGSYDDADMFFPTRSTFTIEAIKPGHTRLCFLPNKEQQKVLKILCDGKDILKSGIDTKPGQEIKDVTVVIGAEKK
jgi:beta-lactamase regulating signal transducer with metallopeptidase domain